MEVVIRFALALAFLAAAAGKLADLERTRSSLADFGVRSRLAGPASWALPLVEIAVAVMLLLPATSRLGGLSVLVLLGVFSAALVRAGKSDCDCFGKLDRAVAVNPLARNAVLAAGAVIVAADEPSVTAAVLILTVLAFGAFAARRWNTESVSAAPEELAVGTDAPPFGLSTDGGGTMTLDDLLQEQRPLALVFSDPSCGACEGLPLRLEKSRAHSEGEITFAVITRGPATELHSGSIPVLKQDEHEIARAYGVRYVPSAVLVDVEGRVASNPMLGEESIANLAAPTTKEKVMQ